MPGLAEVGEAKGERISLIRRGNRNVRIAQLYRADYEARGLRRVKKAADRTASEIKTAPAELLPALVRALDVLLERERILLRIPLPRPSEPAIKPAQTAPTVYEIDRATTTPHVMNEQPATVAPSQSENSRPDQPS